MDKKEEFEAIMREITGGLTGDPVRDMEYLREKTEKYQDHALSNAISAACGKLVLSCLPKNIKEKMLRDVKKHAVRVAAGLEKVEFDLFRGRLDAALELIEKVEKDLSAVGHQDSEILEYRWFDEYFEEYLYNRLYKPKGEISEVGAVFPKAYQLYGYILAELGDFEKAREMQKKALWYNPVGFDLNAEYIDTFRLSGDLGTFFKLTVDAFKIAFRPGDMARCYMNLGHYFTVKELHEAANACYCLSLGYEESEEAQAALFRLEHETDTGLEELTEERIRELAAQYGFPAEPNAEILDLANRSGRYFFERREYRDALYFLRIAYGLTWDDETKALIDEAETRLEEKERRDEEAEGEDAPDVGEN